VSELCLVYCVPSMQICLLSTGQILESGLRVEGNKSGSTFHNNSSDAILSAISNLWSNIQIVKTHILKHNVPNSVSLIIKHLDFEILHCHFRHASNEVICYIFNNVEDVKKICFPTQKHVYYGCTLRKYTNIVFLKTYSLQ